MRDQSETRLQVTKTSDIKEGQQNNIFIIIPFAEMIFLQGIFATTIDFVTWSPFVLRTYYL